MKNKYKYFSPISDVDFKKLFASEQNDALRIQLLNSIITDGSPVVSAELLDPVHVAGVETTAVFDLYCQREDGSRIIVEMQRAVSRVFLNRALAYSSLAFLDQWKAGWKYEIERVYFIGILDGIIFPDSPDRPFTTIMLMSVDEPHFIANEKYLQIFVELPKLASVMPERMTDGELFLNAMRNISTWDERPTAYQDKKLDLLFSESIYGGLTDEERVQHDKQMTTEYEYLDGIRVEKERSRQEGYAEGKAEGEAKGRAEGLAEGRAEGLNEGIHSTRLEIATKLKAAGMDPAAISEITGLSAEAVAAL